MDSGLAALQVHKKRLDDRLTGYLDSRSRELGMVNRWGPDCIDRLKPFVISGKSLRGGLLLYTYGIFHDDLPAYCIDAAASLELLHAGLLIHDDIMDGDAIRRGKPSIYAQYGQIRDVRPEIRTDFGVSMGINAADLCFFMAHELLGSHSALSALLPRISREIQSVVIAQMQDVANSSLDSPKSREDILAVYRYKTARYTFSLPMVMGSVLAQADDAVVADFDHIGESLGILFQISDDSLSSNGDSSVTGKPVGSDARNGKQTLEVAMPYAEFTAYRDSLREEARVGIRNLSVPQTAKNGLLDLVQFCYERTK